jgi:hypothetical protein
MAQLCAGVDGFTLRALSLVEGFQRRCWDARVVFGNPDVMLYECRPEG